MNIEALAKVCEELTNSIRVVETMKVRRDKKAQEFSTVLTSILSRSPTNTLSAEDYKDIEALLEKTKAEVNQILSLSRTSKFTKEN